MGLVLFYSPIVLFHWLILVRRSLYTALMMVRLPYDPI